MSPPFALNAATPRPKQYSRSAIRYVPIVARIDRIKSLFLLILVGLLVHFEIFKLVFEKSPAPAISGVPIESSLT